MKTKSGYESVEKILKALADKNRLRILMLLQGKPRCVCELAHVLGITQPSVSKHLKKLRAAGIIVAEPQGFWTDYRLSVVPESVAAKLMEQIVKSLAKNGETRSDFKLAKSADRTKLCSK